MLRLRRRMLAFTLIFGLGSLSLTGAYGWYLHSTLYRTRLSDKVSAYLNLPVEIGRVVPLDLGTLRLEDVKAFLPDRRAEIFSCLAAQWQLMPDQDRKRKQLKLSDGRLIVSTGQWGRADYRHVLESGLAHDFKALDLDQVQLTDIDLELHQPGWTMKIAKACGTVIMEGEDGKAHAALQASRINGQAIDQPLHFSATFTPSQSLVIHQVSLNVPRIPVAHLQLDSLLGSAVTQGTFAGTIVYREGDPPQVELQGVVDDMRLEELTALMPGGPLTGVVKQVVVEQAVIEENELQLLRFRGKLEELM